MVRHVLLIKFFGGGLEAIPQTNVELTLDKHQPTSIEMTICTYKLVDDEYFNLWDASNLKF